MGPDNVMLNWLLRFLNRPSKISIVEAEKRIQKAELEHRQLQAEFLALDLEASTFYLTRAKEEKK